MMFEEYILLIIENQMMAQLDEDLKLNLTRKRGNYVKSKNAKSHIDRVQSTPAILVDFPNT